jgi:hypothetical protein
MPVKPPPKRARPDALDSELSVMANGAARGFPWFPPPPPPVTSIELARIEAGKLAKREQLDPIQLAARTLLWLLLAVMLVLAWLWWRSL